MLVSNCHCLVLVSIFFSFSTCFHHRLRAGSQKWLSHLALLYSCNKPTWTLKKTNQRKKTQANNKKKPNKRKKLLLIYRYLTSGIQIIEQITLFSSRTEEELRETEDNNFSSAEGNLKSFNSLCLLKSSD